MRKHGVAAFEGQWGDSFTRVTIGQSPAQVVPVAEEPRETPEQYEVRMKAAKDDEDALLFASAGG